MLCKLLAALGFAFSAHIDPTANRVKSLQDWEQWIDHHSAAWAHTVILHQFVLVAVVCINNLELSDRAEVISLQKPCFFFSSFSQTNFFFPSNCDSTGSWTITVAGESTRCAVDVGNKKKNLSNRCIECFRFTDVCFCFVLGFFPFLFSSVKSST